MESLSFGARVQTLVSYILKTVIESAMGRDVFISYSRADNKFGWVTLLRELQSGNGLERCRDHSEMGFKRYVAMGVLGRNLHVLGKLLVAQEDDKSEAAFSASSAA